MFFLCVFVFYFIKISKFALPGVMLMYERTSKDRKKRKKELYYDTLVAMDVDSGSDSDADSI